MKYIFLIILISVSLFSYEKQIILGNYNNEENVENAVKRLSWLSRSDSKLEKLLKDNYVKIVSKNIGDYKVVSLVSFSNYTQLLRTLDVLSKYYEGLYVLDFSLKPKSADKESLEKKVEKIDSDKSDKPVTKTKPIKKTKVLANDESNYVYTIILLPVLAGLGYLLFRKSRVKTKNTQK
jgi:hypothetical protein